MYRYRNLLESKLGKLSDSEFNFAIEEFERHSLKIERHKRKTFAEVLDELSTNIDYYRLHIA